MFILTVHLFNKKKFCKNCSLCVSYSTVKCHLNKSVVFAWRWNKQLSSQIFTYNICWIILYNNYYYHLGMYITWTDGEQSVLRLGCLCLPCSVRDTAWSWLWILRLKTKIEPIPIGSSSVTKSISKPTTLLALSREICRTGAATSPLLLIIRFY